MRGILAESPSARGGAVGPTLGAEQSGVDNVSDDAVVGRTGTVVVRIRGEGGPGEVSVAVRGGTETFLAYALQEIAVDAVVLVVASRGARAVDVQPWG